MISLFPVLQSLKGIFTCVRSQMFKNRKPAVSTWVASHMIYIALSRKMFLWRFLQKHLPILFQCQSRRQPGARKTNINVTNRCILLTNNLPFTKLIILRNCFRRSYNFFGANGLDVNPFLCSGDFDRCDL